VFEFIEGEIAGRSAARLVIDVGGVGYDLLVPLSASFPAKGKLRVYTHFVVREDSQQLFGFPDVATREMFRALLTVKGVGPKMALAVLSGLSCGDLLKAILAKDATKLTTVRGVGLKTAEQILLDLRNKAAVLQAAAGESSEARDEARMRERLEDAVTALISIGYSEKEARKQIERAAKKVEGDDVESLVRAALQG
jgi:Holliday junction DNA helicase RuvA